jgi:hypothetical protein
MYLRQPLLSFFAYEAEIDRLAFASSCLPIAGSVLNIFGVEVRRAGLHQSGDSRRLCFGLVFGLCCATLSLPPRPALPLPPSPAPHICFSTSSFLLTTRLLLPSRPKSPRLLLCPRVCPCALQILRLGGAPNPIAPNPLTPKHFPRLVGLHDRKQHGHSQVLPMVRAS